MDKAAKKWADALEPARAAHTAAKEKDEYDKAKADAGLSSTVTHLAKELKRLKVKDKEAKDAVEKANAQKLRDKEADTPPEGPRRRRRAQGRRDHREADDWLRARH